MLGILILFLIAAILAFPLAFFLPRFGKLAAWLLGSVPALWLAVESRETLANPLTILFIVLVMWLPPLAGALTGASLARRLAARRAEA